MKNIGKTDIGDWYVTDEKQWSNGKHLRWKCLCKLCKTYHWVLARSLNAGVSQRCQNCRRRLHRKGFEQINGTHWKVILKSAKERNLPVTITIEFLWELYCRQQGQCAISKLPISFGYKKAGTASLDRIKNNEGYHEDNVQWVHKDINRMKWKHEQAYFIALCKAVARIYEEEPK